MEQGLEDVVEMIPKIENWGSHFPDTETVARHVTLPGVIGVVLHMKNRPPQLVTSASSRSSIMACIILSLSCSLEVFSYICRGCLSIHRLITK
jgi:hypothetical protein